jgi:hypothetical protein
MDCRLCFEILTAMNIKSTVFWPLSLPVPTCDQAVARPLPKHRTTQTQNKRTQTFTPQVGFEPTIPVFVREKIVHALDREATVIGVLVS